MLYYLEKVKKVPSPPASWTIKGSAVHGALEAWELGGRGNTNLEDIYDTSWRVALERAEARFPDHNEWIMTPRVKNIETDLALRRQQGLSEVIEYAKMALANDDVWAPATLPDGTLAIEVPFKIDFGSDTPFFLIGYIDILKYWKQTGVITVGDYKTGGAESENYRQLGLYAYAATTQYDIPIRWGEYYYTKLNRSSGWKDLSRYTGDYLYQQYSVLDQAIDLGLFVANPSQRQCKTCGVKQFCPEMKDR